MSKRLTRVIVALMLVSLTVGVAIAGAQGRSNEFTASMAGSKETPKGPSAAKGTFKVEFRSGQACYTMSVRALGAKPPDRHRPQADVQGHEPARLEEVRHGQGERRERDPAQPGGLLRQRPHAEEPGRGRPRSARRGRQRRRQLAAPGPPRSRPRRRERRGL